MPCAVLLACNGEFRTRPHMVGSTDEEIEAVARGEVAQERRAQIGSALYQAANDLWFAPVLGRA